MNYSNIDQINNVIVVRASHWENENIKFTSK